jgi:flavin reductase
MSVCPKDVRPGLPPGPSPRPEGPRPDDCSARFRSVLGRFTTGVVLLTAGRRQPRGMTAGSFTSVSLDPPLVLVCVSCSASVHASVVEEQGFAVSVLSAGQRPVARRFADPGRPRGSREFEGVNTFPGGCTGAPLIGGALAWLECSLAAVYDGGDHSVFLGSVLDLAAGTPGDPLLHFGGAFHTLDRGLAPGATRQPG